MNESSPALSSPAPIGRPGIDWAGDGALGGPAEERPAESAAPNPVSAPLRLRAAGFAIDFAILLVLALIVLPVVTVIAGVDTTAPAAEVEQEIEDLYPLLYVILAVIQFGYSLLWNSIGWSPGKRVVGLRTVNRQGQRPGLLLGMRRSAGLMINVFGLGYLWAFVDREKRTWHDHIGRTWVVRVDSEGRSGRR
ncbi:MAG: RDD family protein [Dehalococcoidia bacterium]